MSLDLFTVDRKYKFFSEMSDLETNILIYHKLSFTLMLKYVR